MVDRFGHRERIVFVLLASREIATVLYRIRVLGSGGFDGTRVRTHVRKNKYCSATWQLPSCP